MSDNDYNNLQGSIKDLFTQIQIARGIGERQHIGVYTLMREINDSVVKTANDTGGHKRLVSELYNMVTSLQEEVKAMRKNADTGNKETKNKISSVTVNVSSTPPMNHDTPTYCPTGRYSSGSAKYNPMETTDQYAEEMESASGRFRRSMQEASTTYAPSSFEEWSPRTRFERATLREKWQYIRAVMDHCQFCTVGDKVGTKIHLMNIDAEQHKCQTRMEKPHGHYVKNLCGNCCQKWDSSTSEKRGR